MILFSVVVLLMLSTIVARTAYADQVTIVPDGVVSSGGWTGVTAGNLSDGAGGGGGGDATFATITGVLDTFTVSMSNDAAYSGATINSVRTFVRASVVGGGGQGEQITFGSSAPVVSTSGTNTLTDETTRTNHFYDLTGINTDADVDNLEISVNTSQIQGGEEARIFEVWVVVDYTPAAAPNEINTCDGCHGLPPIEAASRNATEGAVVGSHAAHGAYTCTVCHPNNVLLTHRGAGSGDTGGQINMLANIEGGTYQYGTAFAQDNDINGTGLGTCSDVNCHGGASSTSPQWGTTGTLDCTSCHGAPPATNAHATHYTAKGWTSPDTAGTTCATCHPDNTGTHSDVTDGIITVNAGLTPSGTSPAISCGTAPTLGCHNGKATPNWNTTNIACTDCHTEGGTDPADPVTGLHDETPTISGVIHNPSDANFSTCEDCHSATPSDNHWDGTVQNSAPVINFNAAVLTFTDGTPPTCTTSCHSESGNSGPWERKWHENSDQTDGTECAGCHGDWNSGWNGGVTHRTDTGAGSVRATHSAGTNYECQDCHSLGKVSANTGYTFTLPGNDWSGTSNHGNDLITINDNGVTWGRSGGLSGCSDCHAAYDGTDGASNQHSFTETGWNFERVTGEAVNAGCDSCHGNAGEYWPQGGAYPDRAGRHATHITELAAELGITLPGSDAEQKQMCDYCHNDAAGAGGGGHNDNVEPADVGDFNKIWDASADGTATYTAANQTCANQCHNGKTTTAGSYGWRDATTVDCTMCHTAGGGEPNEIINPTSGLHAATPTVSGVSHNPSDPNFTSCEDCHTANPSSAHRDGIGQNDNPIITIAGVTGFIDDDVTPDNRSCATACHADTGSWERKWHSSSENSDGTECVGCHGTFFTGFNTGVAARHQTAANGDTGGEIQANHATGTGPDTGKLCGTCHAYDGADGLGHQWASHHLDGNIQLSDNTAWADNGNTVGCGACHNNNDGTADGGHEFEDAGVINGWGRQFVAGPAAGCTGCHNAHGTGKAGVGPDSPHVVTTRGGSFNACTDCHPGGSTGSQHSATGVISVPNNATVGINYQTGVNGYSGYSGVVLGGDDVNANPSGKTEAEWCWGCHEAQTPDVSEWDGSSATYDYGSVTTDNLNWTTTSWQSGQPALFAYKAGPLSTPPGSQVHSSTHGTNGGSSGVDALANISCSYCHDVHDTGGGTNDLNPPFLRGSWQSNPYPEDGAPRTGVGQTINSGFFGPVPRGDQNNNYGGYQIDQNNTGITVLDATNGAGLCELCHGNGDGTFSAAEIGSLDLDGSASTDWVSGSNSHARVVKGGDGAGAFNLYDEDVRLPSSGFATTSTDGGRAGRPSMSYMQQVGGQDGYGFRGTDGRSFVLSPGITGATRPYGYNQYNWGASVDNATVDPAFHQFSCSKCHNPHASRLPRLLITNCLDTKNNNWDETYPALPNAGTSNGFGSDTVSAENANVTWSNATSAQNCHRLKDPAFPQAGGDGWNNVSPW